MNSLVQELDYAHPVDEQGLLAIFDWLRPLGLHKTVNCFWTWKIICIEPFKVKQVGYPSYTINLITKLHLSISLRTH